MQLINDPAILARISVATRQAGEPFFADLVAGVRREEIALVVVQDGFKVPSAALDFDTRRRPLVILVAGDLDTRTVGPEDFPGIWRAFRWAAATIFHAAAGEADHAKQVLMAAAVMRRILVIETGTAALPSWLGARDRYAPHRPALVIKPRDGLPHPIGTAPAGAVMQ